MSDLFKKNDKNAMIRQTKEKMRIFKNCCLRLVGRSGFKVHKSSNWQNFDIFTNNFYKVLFS